MADIYRNEPMENIPAGPREPRLLRRISWGAVWGGVMVALGAEALLTFFGLFIGFVAFNPAGGAVTGFTVWSWAWFWVTSFLALYAGGHTTVRLSGVESGTGGMNGLVTWGLTTIATVVFFAWTATGALGSVANILGSAIGSATSSASGNAAAIAVPRAASVFGSAAWSIALLFWIGLAIGAMAAWVGGKRGETVLPEARA